MPQDDKREKKLKERAMLDADRALSKIRSKEYDKEYDSAKKSLMPNYKPVVTPAKKGPELNSSNSAGATQRGMSSPSLDHIQSAEQKQMRVRDTPLSATPDAMLATPKIKSN
mgnify:FL=1